MVPSKNNCLQCSYEGGLVAESPLGGSTMEEGTIVHVDYELYNGESGDLIETTREAVAKEHEPTKKAALHPHGVRGRRWQPHPRFRSSPCRRQGQQGNRGHDQPATLTAKRPTANRDHQHRQSSSERKDPNSLYIGAPVNIGNRRATCPTSRRSCPHRLQPPHGRKDPEVQLQGRQGR